MCQECASYVPWDNETCDYCNCCTNAQCSTGNPEKHCPTNSVGDSTCPCTCD